MPCVREIWFASFWPWVSHPPVIYTPGFTSAPQVGGGPLMHEPAAWVAGLADNYRPLVGAVLRLLRCWSTKRAKRALVGAMAGPWAGMACGPPQRHTALCALWGAVNAHRNRANFHKVVKFRRGKIKCPDSAPFGSGGAREWPGPPWMPPGARAVFLGCF